MKPFSMTRPNPMIPVGGEYVIDHTLRLLKEAGVSLVNLVIGHKGDLLREHLAEGHPSGLSINFIDQGEPKGIGKAVLKAKDKFAPGEYFMLVYSDTLTTENIFSVTLQSFSLCNEPTASVCHTVSGEKYGNVYISQDAEITRFVEKPKKTEKLGNYVFAGVFVLPASFFDYLEQAKGDMEKALKALIKKDTLHASIWEKEWLDMAYPWDVLKANRSILDTWTNAVIHDSVEVRGAVLKGPVHISEGVEIKSGAVLQGPAYIGPGCFIGHNSLIRPYTCIGAGSVIGQSAELKNCVIFPNTKVGRLSFIGDSVVGEKADIGAGTMTINRFVNRKAIPIRLNNKTIKSDMEKLGSFIGDGAIIGAAHTIAPGTIVEAGRMIEHNYSSPKRL